MLLFCTCTWLQATSIVFVVLGSTRVWRAVESSHLSDIHPDRFYQWPNGAVIMPIESGSYKEHFHVRLPNGSTVDHVIPVQDEGGNDHDRRQAEEPDYYSGWVEYSGYEASGNVTRMYAKWTVPPPPPHYNILTTVFLFAGLEANNQHTSTDIIQPVLQYGHSGCGGGNHWSAASFYVAGITAHCGKTLRVETGDVIEASMTYNQSKREWMLITTVISQRLVSVAASHKKTPPALYDSSSPTSVLSVQVDHSYHWAVVTLEAIRVYSCSAYPSGHSTQFSSIEVEVEGSVVQPRWNKTVHYHECGQAVDVVNSQTTVVYYNSTTAT